MADREQLRPLCRAVYLDTTQYIGRLPEAKPPAPAARGSSRMLLRRARRRAPRLRSSPLLAIRHFELRAPDGTLTDKMAALERALDLQVNGFN